MIDKCFILDYLRFRLVIVVFLNYYLMIVKFYARIPAQSKRN